MPVTYPHHARPNSDLIPAAMAKALEHMDSIAERLRTARKTLAELDTPQAADKAAADDERAAIKAASTGKPVPAPTAGPQHAEALAQAQREVAALTAAHEAALSAAHTARYAAYDVMAGDQTEQARRDDAEAKIADAAQALADMIQAEHDRRVVPQWLRTGQPPQRAAMITPWVMMPGLLSRHIGPGDERELNQPVHTALSRLVAATLGGN